MKSVIIVLALFVGVCVSYEAGEDLWAAFKNTYDRTYEGIEDSMRRIVFENNLQYIEKFNAEGNSYTLAVNKFADLTHSEFTSIYLGRKPNPEGKREPYYPVQTTANDTVDWRDKGYVTGIKDQGQCGSCWAFSAIGSLEGQYFNKTHKLVSFSEQELVDCSKNGGNAGCQGGDMDAAFEYIEKNGIESESDYKYRAKKHKCEYDASKVVTKISGYKDIPSGSISAMHLAVGSVGPISAAMDASHDSFQFYSEGIYHPRKCGKKDNQLDHGVLAIGYGVTPQAYWLMKNSWGTDWGMDGYFKIAQKENECGICTSSSYPIM
ncbi:Cathepsin L [Oopsacas minuta]|uniref:Cathepsin L n=1 Tax=Oopsacas minuta TaxID=111878 RepID=A0AAV7JLQ8_9METZ|nr:Cathepsin L [Oopsacas minuta]